MIRVCILKKDGNTISKNLPTRNDADDWILDNAEDYKKIVVRDTETGEKEYLTL